MADAYDPDYWSYDDEGNPEFHGHGPKEEPDCYTCGDTGRLTEPGGQRVVNCHDCNPTAEQAAANARAAAEDASRFDGSAPF